MSRRRLSVITAAVLLAMGAAHLGMFGYAITHWGWTVAIGAAAAVAAKLTAVIIAYRLIQTRRDRNRPEPHRRHHVGRR